LFRFVLQPIFIKIKVISGFLSQKSKRKNGVAMIPSMRAYLIGELQEESRKKKNYFFPFSSLILQLQSDSQIK